jgi:hypothetical protein
MSKLSEKTTLYLNPYVKKFLQLKALQENRSMSDIVNDEFADLLEDLEDAYELSKRKENPVFLPWVEVKKQLAQDGKL